MNELTKGWAKTVSLFDICRPKQWKTVAKKDLLPDGYPVYGANGKIGFFSTYTHENPTVMITCRGASCGNIHISEPKSYINGNAMALDSLDSSVDVQYLFYALRFSNFDTIISGSAQPQITQEGLKSLNIPLPKLEEQKRIADKLDSVLAKVEAAQARLDKIPAILKRFRQSVLAAATSGELTKEWRENAGISEMNWYSDLLKNLAHSISDGDHQAPPRANEGIPFLVISNVSKGNIEFSKVSRWVPHEYFEKLKNIRKPERGDILYTVTGSYGIPIVVDTDKPFCFQRHIAILKPDLERISSSYLSLWLESPLVFKHAGEVATGTAQKTVSLSNLRKFQVSVPPLDEQAKIVESATNLFMKMDSVKKQYVDAKERLDKLTQSLLAKAFKGELLLSSVDSDIEAIENSVEALNA